MKWTEKDRYRLLAFTSKYSRACQRLVKPKQVGYGVNVEKVHKRINL
jgi:hypothetical protein